jgi:hypothetical protein
LPLSQFAVGLVLLIMAIQLSEPCSFSSVIGLLWSHLPSVCFANIGAAAERGESSSRLGDMLP